MLAGDCVLWLVSLEREYCVGVPMLNVDVKM